MGSGQSEIEAVEARDREAHDESRGAKENCGWATEEMGTGEGEESQLNDNDHVATKSARITLPRTPFLARISAHAPVGIHNLFATR